MGRFMRWLRQLLTGRKEGRKDQVEENHVASDGPERERKRWSFVKQRKSGADGGGPATSHQAAVAAAAAAAAGESRRVKSFRCEEEEDVRGQEQKAALLIQKTFRGYLARKALRALRSLVKIQALVRGYLVRKQTAMTLRRLQTLVRLQTDSIAMKKASCRRSMEQQVRISEQETRLQPPPATPVHRRRLSDSTDSNYERSPRIVEMDTCHLRSRSSRMAGRFTPDHSTPESYRPAALAAPSCSPLPGGKLQATRLSFRRYGAGHDDQERERDPRGSKTAHSTPRFASSAQAPYDSPAKSVVEYGLVTSTPRRTPTHRDGLVSPRYMAGTASSAARTRCHSTPRQRQQSSSAEVARTSLARAGSRRSCPHAHVGFCSQCSDASRRAGCSDLVVDHDEVARDYYLDSFW